MLEAHLNSTDMDSKIKLLLLSLVVSFLLISSLKAQNYETTGVVALGSGILEGETYKSVIILGDPSASDDMLEGENISANSGFIFVEEEPLTVLGVRYPIVNLSVFPNPTSEYLTIGVGGVESREYLIKVLSLDGKVHISKKLLKDDLQGYVLDVSTLMKSVYILSITSDQGLTKHLRFVKQ